MYKIFLKLAEAETEKNFHKEFSVQYNNDFYKKLEDKSNIERINVILDHKKRVS